MTHSLTTYQRIRMLLNAMRGERHARCALANELCAELEAEPALKEATNLGRKLAQELESGPLADESYERELARITSAVAERQPLVRQLIGDRARRSPNRRAS